MTRTDTPFPYTTPVRSAMTDLNLDELRDELADFAQPQKKGGRTPREERIIAGFEEVQRFVDEHGRAPRHGEGNDIFERLYAVRLDRDRKSTSELQSLMRISYAVFCCKKHKKNKS